MSSDRALIMETNKSLRSIKNELENLLEKGVIDETVYDQIHTSLPQESPLSGPLRTTANASHNQTTSQNQAPPRESAQSPPIRAFNNLSVSSQPSPANSTPGLPTYEDTPPPSLPNRNTPAPPGRPTIAQARALYRYNASDSRDVSFEKDDRVSVFEHMNADWWMGRNERTGQEGIFPRNYVLVESENKSAQPPYQQPAYGYPVQGQGPPQQQNPYNANVPPMAVADGGQPAGQQGHGKVGEYGKKFGKKMGNAAIFGAGATIGSNIVNSIF